MRALLDTHVFLWWITDDDLPDHHRDPFDRLLVAQCLVEGVPLLSADQHIARYGVEIIW